MFKQKPKTQVLDLTDYKTLYELAIEQEEFFGPKGSKLLNDLKDRAAEADYTHLYFRDPVRPGVVWFSQLQFDGEATHESIPTRGKLDECRSITENVFPNFLNEISNADVNVVMAQTPPITADVSGIELVTALEYIIFLYPEMVRAWAALIFAYGEILHMKDAAEAAYNDCVGTCTHSQMVGFLMGESSVVGSG